MNYRLSLKSRSWRLPAFFRSILAAAVAAWSTFAFCGKIHAAATGGDVEKTKALFAAMSGDVEKVKALLAGDPELVFSKDEHGWTPLYGAAASGRKDLVELLIANKADVNAFNQGFTPLHAAVLNHHKEVADLLLANNAELNIDDAAAGGYLEQAKALLKDHPELALTQNREGWTPLHFAARNGHKDLVELLLAYKPDVNAKDSIGMTPLQVACSFSTTPRPNGSEQWATKADYEGIAELLIANGADIKGGYQYGMTALHNAASAGFPNAVKALLDRNANINARDNLGRTPLDMAAARGNRDVIELLLARGAEMDPKDREGLKALADAEKKVQTRTSSAYEYEVDGLVNQTMIWLNSTNRHASASFTVYARDSGWLIKSVETNENGGVVAREIGSTNGTEIYECMETMATIQSGEMPVGQLDSAVSGHLWLMFASRSYWPGLKSDQLRPVYDWHASAAAGGQDHRVSADWELLPGADSLPREVRYLDSLNHTNAVYTVTGTNSVGGMLFPAGFVFKQFNGDRLIKHVEVEVTGIRPVCSRSSLIPLPKGRTIIIDSRIDSGMPNRPSSYQNPVIGQWPTLEEAKELAGVSKANEVRNLARVGISPFPETRSTSQQPDTNPAPVLSLSIRCTNDVVKAGDEIPIEFKITNRGWNDYKYENRTYDRSGRMNEYSLAATNGAGEAVPDPRANDKGFWFGGGGFQYAILKPGQSFTKVIPLNRWALVKEGGRYEVVGTYTSSAYGTNFATVISDPITLTVQARTPQEMDAYIGDLTNQLEAKLTGRPNPVANESRPPDEAVNELVTKLMFTCSPKIVPSLLKSAADYGSGGGFWEHEAITFYVPHSEETKQAILAAANARGLERNWTLASLLREYDFTGEQLKPLIERALAADNEAGWAVGAQLAAKFGDDAFTPRLAAIARTPRSDAQTAAIGALAARRTDEGVKTLKSLLDDPHEIVWTPLADALLNGYRNGTWQPGDFTAQDVKPLIGRMLASGSRSPDVVTGISLLKHFGSDDFTAQLIGIATDTSKFGQLSAVYALAFNRTDEGLKTLKSLLNSTDPRIRGETEDAIRAAYTSRGDSLGKPLQPEDFDKQYQQPRAER